jgi:hypothetical protein
VSIGGTRRQRANLVLLKKLGTYIIQNGNVYKIFCIDYEWISHYTLQFPHSFFSVRGYQEKNTLTSAREI